MSCHLLRLTNGIRRALQCHLGGRLGKDSDLECSQEKLQKEGYIIIK